MTERGIVCKAVGGVFTVLNEKNSKTVCYAPKKLRFCDKDILVGDKVEFETNKSNKKGLICDVFQRKNKLSRPEIANVDVCCILIANLPEPDFYLVDKVIVNCFEQNILPVVVVNKCDLGNETFDLAQKNYSKVCDVVSVSANNNDFDCLKKYFKKNIVCFVGQSAVGKTSLLNAFIPGLLQKTGDVSEKSGRGTHTTRQSSLHTIYDGFLVDTCGFSLCELSVKSCDLHLYYDDFVTQDMCKYSSCTHTVEPNCAVKKAVENGTIFKDRYERYLFEYKELVEKEKNQF